MNLIDEIKILLGFAGFSLLESCFALPRTPMGAPVSACLQPTLASPLYKLDMQFPHL
jgi:hypothetical protein